MPALGSKDKSLHYFKYANQGSAISLDSSKSLKVHSDLNISQNFTFALFPKYAFGDKILFSEFESY